MGSYLRELEALQTRILERIAHLELSLNAHRLSSLSLSSGDGDGGGGGFSTESRLSAVLLAGGVRDFSFKRVPSDYYDRSLEERRDILGAPSIDHLCKSIVLVCNPPPLSFSFRHFIEHLLPFSTVLSLKL